MFNKKVIKKNPNVVKFLVQKDEETKNINLIISHKVIFLNRKLGSNDEEKQNFYWFLLEDNKKETRYTTKTDAFEYIKNNYKKVKVNIKDNMNNFFYELEIYNQRLISIHDSKEAYEKDEKLKNQLFQIFGEIKKDVKKVEQIDSTKHIQNNIKINKDKLSKKDKKSKKVLNKQKITNSIIRGSIIKSSPLLKIKNLTKQFGSFKALDNISFQIKRGERIGLIGGNGAGKTTLTEIIAGINKPTSGTITYGFDFEDTPKENIGMQFQQSTYPSGLTVKDIIKFAINLRKLTISPAELLKLMIVFQMEEFYARKVRSLSGGQRQKLNILLSILHNPKLVILDELSTGLDISAREEIINFADKLLKDMDMSAIVISHHMGEIASLCSRVVVLDRGKVVRNELIDDIVKEHGSLEEYTKKIIRTSNEKAREKSRIKNENTSEIKKLNKKQKKTKLSKKVDKQNKKQNKINIEEIKEIKKSKKEIIKKTANKTKGVSKIKEGKPAKVKIKKGGK